MKTVSFTFCFLILSTNLFTQGYTSFVDTNSTWRDIKIDYFYHGPSYMNYEIWDAQERINGDTIIGKKYYKLFRTGYKHHFLWDHGVSHQDTIFDYCELFIGGLREDSSKHVYFINTNGVESLLFDFNLEIGDTLKSLLLQIGYDKPLIVQSIDSVQIFDKYRKRFIITGSIFDTLNLIEGIGTDLGLLGNLISWNYIAGMYDYLSVYYYEKHKSYFGFKLDTGKKLIDCNNLNTICLTSKYGNNYLVFPNPSFDYLIIEPMKPSFTKNTKIIILDHLGRSVYVQRLNSFLDPIDVHFLKDGLYYLKILEDQEEIVFDKFIKISR